MRKYLTLLKRELWENKTSFIMFPLISTALIMLLLCAAYLRLGPGFSSRTAVDVFTPAEISTTHSQSPTPANAAGPHNTPITAMDDQQHAAEPAAPEINLEDEFNQFRQSLNEKLNPTKTHTRFINVTLWLTTAYLCVIFFFTGLSYAHRTLFDDRKTREILFWRSLPVSEFENVGAKLFIVYVFIPVAILLLTLSSCIFIWLFSGLVTAEFTFEAPSIIASTLGIFVKTLMVLVALSPLITWSLFSSALAKKSPFGISTLLPIALMLGEKLVAWAIGFNLHISNTIKAYVGFIAHFSSNAPNNFAAISPLSVLWVFLASALFVGAAIWLRNNRYEI